jgi:hypothetical protein
MIYLSYSVILDDGEMYVLQEALSHYLALCERELAKGVKAPFWAYRESIKHIRSNLDDSIRRGTRDYERWVRSTDRKLALHHAPARKRVAKRALPRTRPASMSGDVKQKPR